MKKVTETQKELIALAEATLKKEQLKSLTQSAKIVLGDIINLSKLDFYKDNGYCFRTNLDIMTDCDIKSKKTLYLALNTLESLNLIQRISGGKKDANRFILKSGLESGLAKSTDNEEVKPSGLAILIEKVDYLIKCTSLLSQQTQYLSKIAEYLYKCTSPSSVPDKCTIDIEIDKDIDKESYIVNSIESITEKENKNNINNTLTELKESDGKTVDMENNNEIINNFSFVDDESTVNEIDGEYNSIDDVSNESTIDPNNVIGVAAVQQPQKLSNIYFSFSRDGKDNSISSTNDGKDNIISKRDNNNDSMTSTEVQEKRDSNNDSITSTNDNKDEIGNDPQNLLYNKLTPSPRAFYQMTPNTTTLEIWKPVVGYEGLYEVSNLGRIKSLNYRRTGNERILKPATNHNGYFIVNLHKDGKAKSHYVHRLIAEAFIPNPNNLPQINHIDENKANNNVNNLEYCTAKYNSNYGTHNIKISKSRSKPVLQLTLDGQLVREWPSTIEAEQQGGFQNSNISLCCSGKHKSHHGFIWKYKENSSSTGAVIDEDFKRSIYQRLVYDPSQTNEQIKDLYNDIVKLRDSNEIPQNEMDLIVYGFKDKVKYISALRDKCKL